MRRRLAKRAPARRATRAVPAAPRVPSARGAPLTSLAVPVSALQVPVLRPLAMLAWTPHASALDIAQLLNSLVLYTCTVGVPSIGMIAFFEEHRQV